MHIELYNEIEIYVIFIMYLMDRILSSSVLPISPHFPALLLTLFLQNPCNRWPITVVIITLKSHPHFRILHYRWKSWSVLNVCVYACVCVKFDMGKKVYQMCSCAHENMFELLVWMLEIHVCTQSHSIFHTFSFTYDWFDRFCDMILLFIFLFSVLFCSSLWAVHILWNIVE